MANIGSFKKVGSDFQGEIVTLSLQTKGVRIVPETNRSNDNTPSHRVYVGRAEIGAAWSKRSNEGRDYLSLKLDDPSFNAPIFANLFDDEDSEGYTLIWSRPASATATEPTRLQRPARSLGRGFARSLSDSPQGHFCGSPTRFLHPLNRRRHANTRSANHSAR